MLTTVVPATPLRCSALQWSPHRMSHAVTASGLQNMKNMAALSQSLSRRVSAGDYLADSPLMYASLWPSKLDINKTNQRR